MEVLGTPSVFAGPLGRRAPPDDLELEIEPGSRVLLDWTVDDGNGANGDEGEVTIAEEPLDEDTAPESGPVPDGGEAPDNSALPEGGRIPDDSLAPDDGTTPNEGVIPLAVVISVGKGFPTVESKVSGWLLGASRSVLELTTAPGVEIRGVVVIAVL